MSNRRRRVLATVKLRFIRSRQVRSEFGSIIVFDWAPFSSAPGIPAMMDNGATSFVTTELAPIFAPRPMGAPAIISRREPRSKRRLRSTLQE